MQSTLAHKRTQAFLSRFPQLFHVSLCDTPEDILNHGLWSAAGLIRRAAQSSDSSLLTTQRRKPIKVQMPWGMVVVNDQRPLPRAALLRCLDHMTPEEWYAELNERIFFFVRFEAAARFASVRTSRMPGRTMFTIDATALYEAVGCKLELSPINTGNAMRNPAKRSRMTFLPIKEYPLEEVSRRRGWRHAVAEASVRTEYLDLRSILVCHSKQLSSL